MKRTTLFPSQRERGGVLLTALLFATALAIGLAGYIALARQTMIAAQRTFHSRDALGLAESGLEEAIDCFRQMDAGLAAATAWADWTLNGSTARRTFAPLDRDGRALATLKVYVTGYDGSSTTPLVISQATLVPFDGSAPISRVVELSLDKQSYFLRGVVAREGLTFTGQAAADSYNSNPTGSPTGPWAAYPGTGASANTRVIVATGSISLTGQARIDGDLMLGPTVSPPAASRVSGTISQDFSGTFPMPAYPAAGSVSRSYTLGSSIPGTLPVSGHEPASDGAYYYFCDATTIRDVTISAGRNVRIVGTNTSLSSGIGLQSGATLRVYMDGVVTIGNSALTNSNWAGAMQIFTTTSDNCSIGGNGSIYACLYAPNAALSCTGGGSSGMLVGSFVARTITATGGMKLHYDEALQLPGAGSPFTITRWYERRSQADRAALGSLTGDFLP